MVISNSQYDDLYNYLRLVDPLNNDGVKVRYQRMNHRRIKQVHFVGNFTEWRIKNNIRCFNRAEFNEWAYWHDYGVRYYGGGLFKEIRRD